MSNETNFNQVNSGDGASGQQGSGNTQNITNNYGDKEPTWDDVASVVGDNEEGTAHVNNMQMLTEQQMTPEHLASFKDGIAWMKIQSPDAVPIVKQLVGDKPELMELFD